jgi:peptide/nickel transport system substrate-binding protein
MRRRDVLKSAVAGSMALAAPGIASAQGSKVLKFVPHADLASIDPVWTTADITRNYSLAVFDTLYGVDAQFNPHPQMAAGHSVSSDGRTWEITLRDGLKFHDGTPVLAKDCVATIARFSKRNALGQALAERTDEMSAPSDKMIRIRLKKPFSLLPTTLAQYDCAIMPARIAATDAMTQIPEAIGSGPFKFKADERVPGAKVVFVRNPDYVPRPDGTPSFTAGPKIAHFDRVEWTVMPDPATASAALTNNEVDWWENPTIDLIPMLKRDKKLTLKVTDITGEIGCLRFNHLLPPFNNVAIRKAVLAAINQKDIMDAVAGAEPSLIKTDVGLFVPGTQFASTVGIEKTHQYGNLEKIKQDIVAAGYKGERIVVLGATTIPIIHAAAQVCADVLKKIGFNVDYQALEWGTVVQRRASKEPIDKGGWNIFWTYLGGTGNISPATMLGARGNGERGWFGWPTSAKMEQLRDAWFEAPDLATQKKLCAEMQAEFWEYVPYVPLGMFDQPTAFHTYLTDIRDGYPQFYGVKRV